MSMTMAASTSFSVLSPLPVALTLAIILTWGTLPVAGDVRARLCVTSDGAMSKCMAMKTAFDSANLKQLECVRAQNQYECMRLIKAGQAEMVRAGSTDIFAAGKFYGLVPIVKESRSTNPTEGEYMYKAVIIIKTGSPITSLDGLYQRKSCHTGVGRTVGWTVPVSNLQAMGIMTVRDCDNPVKSVSDFFLQSCAAGAFRPVNNIDNDNPANICMLCGSPQCPASDQYAGYSGAVHCLRDGRGEVAFAKHSTIGSMAADDHSIRKEDFRLLCPDGTIKTVDEWNLCSWATRPTDVMVASPALPAETISALRGLLERGSRMFNGDTGFNMFSSADYNGRNLLFTDGTKQLRSVSNTNYAQYLDTQSPGFLNTMTDYVSCPYTDRWCVVSQAEEDKCVEMSAAFASARITHQMQCVRAQSHKECMEKMEKDEADLVTLDGGDVYTAGKSHNLVPILAENYGSNNGTSYWAVAVVRRNNRNVNINNLKGKTSCHTGIQKTSGWNVPIGTLIEKGFVKTADTMCGIVKSVGKFFSKSCVPGALDSKYNPKGSNPANLCELCGGRQFCQRDSSNKYYGYKGAFRCLVEKNADVAFIKHNTVSDNTDGKLTEDWASQLRSEDFELLCLDGSRKPIDQWASCNLAKVPSHAVVTRAQKAQRDRQHYITILKKAQLWFGPNNSGFRIFSTSGGRDALFDDATISLSGIMADRQDYRKYLGSEYFGALTALDKKVCSSAGVKLVSVSSFLLACVYFIVVS